MKKLKTTFRTIFPTEIVPFQEMGEIWDFFYQYDRLKDYLDICQKDIKMAISLVHFLHHGITAL